MSRRPIRNRLADFAVTAAAVIAFVLAYTRFPDGVRQVTVFCGGFLILYTLAVVVHHRQTVSADEMRRRFTAHIRPVAEGVALLVVAACVFLVQRIGEPASWFTPLIVLAFIRLAVGLTRVLRYTIRQDRRGFGDNPPCSPQS